MSIKTLRKRIALVAVSALGVGLLSVAPASAAIDAGTFNYSAANSVGICAFGAETDNTTKVGEVLSTGVIALAEAGANITLPNVLNDSITVSISGPAVLSGVTADSTNTSNAGDARIEYPSATSVRFRNSSTTTDVDGSTARSAGQVDLPQLLTFRVTGTGTIQLTVSKVATGVASTLERYTFTSSATCATGVASPANSLIKVVEYSSGDTAAASITDNITAVEARTLNGAGTLVTNYASSADKISNGGTAYIAVRIKDGTSSANDVTTQGTFSASATNGAVVGWDSTALDLQGSSASVTGPATGTAQTETLYVIQGDANEDKPLTTNVTISFNGVVYGTRSITFTGKPTKIEIVGASTSIGKTSTANKYALAYEITDEAGNKLTSAGAGTDGAAAFTTSASENNPVLASSGVIVDPNQSVVTAIGTIAAESTGYAGTVDITCGATSGKTKVYLKYTYSNLSSIRSADYEFSCAGGPVNYKASLDKASYAPGEIATLTITATDSKGNPVYDVDATPAGNDLGSSTYPVSISLPQMTAVTAATNTDEFVGGKKTYKFTVGTTEGSFSGIVDLPLYNSTTYAQAAQTISYKVAAPATGAVSNAEVLAAIVKLIASINKQIRALQKSLRR